MDVTVVPLGGHTEAAYDIWCRAAAVDRPDHPAPSGRAFRYDVAHDRPGQRVDRFVGLLGGAPAGYAELRLPQRDNPRLATLELRVDPARRRRGVGRALHAHAVARARAAGRDRLVAETGGEGAGTAFAAALGARAALHEWRRRLDPADVDVPRLWGAAAGAAAGYRVVTWTGATPDARRGDVALLDARLLADAPIGELDVEPERVDAAHVAEVEAFLLACGRRLWHAGAVHAASGRLVAWTNLTAEEADWHAWQGITIVDPAHRGHRLGLLVKLANLRQVTAAVPGLRAVDTWNAADNAPMVAVNDALGFRPVERCTQWQQAL